MKSPTIEFVNHASVIILYKDISILSDPWFSGTAFQDGWRLMHELQDNEITDVIKKNYSYLYFTRTSRSFQTLVF